MHRMLVAPMAIACLWLHWPRTSIAYIADAGGHVVIYYILHAVHFADNIRWRVFLRLVVVLRSGCVDTCWRQRIEDRELTVCMQYVCMRTLYRYVYRGTFKYDMTFHCIIEVIGYLLSIGQRFRLKNFALALVFSFNINMRPGLQR